MSTHKVKSLNITYLKKKSVLGLVCYTKTKKWCCSRGVSLVSPSGRLVSSYSTPDFEFTRYKVLPSEVPGNHSGPAQSFFRLNRAGPHHKKKTHNGERRDSGVKGFPGCLCWREGLMGMHNFPGKAGGLGLVAMPSAWVGR